MSQRLHRFLVAHGAHILSILGYQVQKLFRETGIRLIETSLENIIGPEKV